LIGKKSKPSVKDYNEDHPHSSIGTLSPMQYSAEYSKQGA